MLVKFILSSVLLLVLKTVSGTNYYFSSSSGDDNRSSSQASNSLTPWRSIDKLNSFFGSLQPGDQVLFKRGETFYGTINISKSGTTGSPIKIGVYGSGNKPIITGLVTLSGWGAKSGYSGVYEAASNSTLGAGIKIVLLNNSQQAIGRYPNPTEPNGGFLTIESHSGNNSITDNELPSSPNWKGADVVIRTNHWTIDKSTITSHSGHTLVYSAGVNQSQARDQYGYFIQNDLRTLDVKGEWYYNPSTKKVSMFFGSAGASGSTVKAATKDNLIYSNNISNVTVDNLELTGCNAAAVDISNGTNMVVQNCDISFSGTDGVNAGGTNFRVENCTVTNSNTDGIDVSRGNGAIVRNNIVTNSYTFPGMGISGNGQGSGIRNCTSGLVEYNQIINSGYIGIQMGGNYSIIRNNLIDNFGYIKDDGGAIYTSNGSNGTNYGRVIAGNIILNGWGAPDGTNSQRSSMQGIYLDDNSNGIEIIDNTVVNCNLGIQLHNSRSVTVRNNTFYNNVTCQFYMKHDALGGSLSNHTITNNIFFSHIATQLTASVTSIANDLGGLGRLDSNYYARPIDEATTIYSSYINSSGTQISGNYDLARWQSLYKFDGTSKNSFKKVVPYTMTNTIGSNLVSFGSFLQSADLKKVWANSSNLSFVSSGVLDGSCLQVSPTANSSSIVIAVGSLSASKKYVLRYSLKGTGNMSIAANLRAASYEPITDLKYWTTSTGRSENEVLFIPTKNESNASIVLTVDAKQTYYIDNIQLYEAAAIITNPDDSIKFVYNASKSNKTISLNGNYVDAKNNKYSGSITLKPYTSAVLIHNGGTSSNSSPTVTITSPKANSSFSTPDVQLTASASDADGTISKVDFYNGNTLITTENDAPYDWTWKNVPVGNYTITAKATDNSGNVTTSSAVSFTVGAAGKSPTVTITSPIIAATYSAPASVRLTANASATVGSITKVEFFSGSTLIATEKVKPYDWTWQNVPAGTYSITAKATDNSGNVTTSVAVPFSVAGVGKTSSGPTVNITSPKVNASYNGPISVYLAASATTANGSIAKVEFYNGKKLLTIERYAPFDFNWQNVQPGSYVITAKATDNSGNVSTSAPVTISVSGQLPVGSKNAPAVVITSPAVGGYYCAVATVNITALATDPDGTISKVEFYNNGKLITTENYAPYDWDWTNVDAGDYTIIAKAYDNSGNVTTSTPVSITVRASVVQNATAKSTPPLSAVPPLSAAPSALPITQAIADAGVIPTLADTPDTVSNSKIRSFSNNQRVTDPSGMVLYPNPASSIVNIKLAPGFHADEKATLTITNSSGSVFKKLQVVLSGNVVVDISSLNPGLYFLNLSGEKMTLTKQFLKMKD